MYTAERVKAAKSINASWKSSLEKSLLLLCLRETEPVVREHPSQELEFFRFFDAVRNICDRNVARYDDFNKYSYVG